MAQRQEDKTCLLKRSVRWGLTVIILLAFIAGLVAFATVFNTSFFKTSDNTDMNNSTESNNGTEENMKKSGNNCCGHCAYIWTKAFSVFCYIVTGFKPDIFDCQ